MAQNKNKNLFILFLTSFTALFLDQLSKYLIKNPVKEGFFIIPKFLKITYFENKGIAFGIKLNEIIIYSFAFLFLIMVLFFYRKILNEKRILIPLGMILGGVMSNIIDRVLYGFIKDIFELYYFSNLASGLIFNLADVFIVLGTTLFIIFFWQKEKELKSQKFYSY